MVITVLQKFKFKTDGCKGYINETIGILGTSKIQNTVQSCTLCVT